MPGQINQKKQIISSEVYNERYFRDVMPGKECYVRSHGAEISNLYKTVLKLADIKKGMTVLDFGCGRGELIYQSAIKGANVIGIDYSDEAIKLSKESISHLPDELKVNSKIIKLSAGMLPLADNSVDRVLLIDVIEHLTNEEMNILLSEFYRILKPEGKLIIHTPNRLHFDWGWKYYTFYVILFSCLLRFKKPKNLHRELRTEIEKQVHINEQDPFCISKTLKKNSFKKYRVILKNIYEGTPLFKQYLTNMICNLWPFSVLWPLKLYFNHSLFVLVIK
jgi:2-polyprenyl-3-methyl-5-hydroxy-6-metoxy-1,4-benzoquinol methylase